MLKKRKVFIALSLALLFALSGTMSALADELIVYSSVDEENARNILDEFSKATGIQVNMVFLSSGPAMSRIEAEKANPLADVWFGAPSENHIIAKDRGLTQPYISKTAEDLAGGFKDPEGYWTAFYMNPAGIRRPCRRTEEGRQTGAGIVEGSSRPGIQGDDPDALSPVLRYSIRHDHDSH